MDQTTCLIPDADQPIIQPKGQVLSIIGPATTGDSAVDLVLGHIFLLRRPESYNKNKAVYTHFSLWYLTSLLCYKYTKSEFQFFFNFWKIKLLC